MLIQTRRDFEPQDEDGLRTAVREFLRYRRAEWRVAVQLCTDLGRMPVEDASAEWSERQSPYRIVGRIVVPPQDAWSPARAEY